MKVEEKRKLLTQLGLDPEDCTAWVGKYNSLKRNTIKEPYSCLLSFQQYVELAVVAGLKKPEQVGRTKGSYQMSRIGDSGNYEVGNCRFILQADNLAERCDNGGITAMIRKKAGRTAASNAGIASQAKKLSKRFKLTSPDGKLFEGINLREFCRNNSLPQACMARVCAGISPSYKGWTGTYIEGEKNA